MDAKGSRDRGAGDIGVQNGHFSPPSGHCDGQGGGNRSNAVFVCFAPYDDPEIVVAMAVEHGGSGGELASMAADVR